MLTGMIEAGHVTPALDRTWPLADTPEAMRTLEHGTVRGKIAVIQ
jgi:NADPH:quinone reductase-like Zn-dependent oxidoreductase